jgi:hypothetical protein
MPGVIDERIDRTKLEFRTPDEAAADDVRYWLSKTPDERIEALEYLRRWAYGNDQIDAGVQRVLELSTLGEG